MSWIDEVRNEIKTIKETPKDLQKFGITVGAVLIVISVFSLWKQWFAFSTAISVGLFGLLLLLLAVLQPLVLKRLNRIWMSFAIIIGSIVARIILAIVFFIIVTPISIFAKAMGKKFYFQYKDMKQKSYWIERDTSKPINYERMN